VRYSLDGRLGRAEIDIGRTGQAYEKTWQNAQLLLMIENSIAPAQLMRELRATMSELTNANSSLKDAQKKLLKAFL